MPLAEKGVSSLRVVSLRPSRRIRQGRRVRLNIQGEGVTEPHGPSLLGQQQAELRSLLLQRTDSEGRRLRPALRRKICCKFIELVRNSAKFNNNNHSATNGSNNVLERSNGPPRMDDLVLWKLGFSQPTDAMLLRKTGLGPLFFQQVLFCTTNGFNALEIYQPQSYYSRRLRLLSSTLAPSPVSSAADTATRRATTSHIQSEPERLLLGPNIRFSIFQGEPRGSSVANWLDKSPIESGIVRGDTTQVTLPGDTTILPDNRLYQESPPYKETTTMTDNVLPVDPGSTPAPFHQRCISGQGGDLGPDGQPAPKPDEGYAATSIPLRADTAMGDEIATYGKARLGVGWRDDA
ncbi:hypothetical protein PG985_011159 [Apiospora marii]|uniref:uncharacterized protein n=1 Tax=Apiospora marii TaxID=335849 RepID=UPI00312E0018